MANTGQGDFPIRSTWVNLSSLSTGIFWSNKNTTIDTAFNNFFFGSFITKRWDGNTWVSANVKRWDGTTWIGANLKTWNGTDWITSQ